MLELLAATSFFKSQGMAGLPGDLRWCYRYLDPFGVQNMPKKAFIVITKAGSLGFGIFPKVKWHKEEGENILGKCDISVMHGEDMQPADARKVGDLEHAKFISERLAGKTIYEIRGVRSPAAVRHHIYVHNEDIVKKGECVRCRRARSPYSKTSVPVGPKHRRHRTAFQKA